MFYEAKKETSRLLRPTSGEVRTEIEDFVSRAVTKKQKTGDNESIASGSQFSARKPKPRKTRTDEVLSEMSLSAMSEDFVGRTMGLDIKKLLNQEKRELDGMIALSSDNLSDLYDIVYERILESIGALGYPNDLEDETHKSKFVDCLFNTVVSYMKKKFELTNEELIVKGNYTFEIWFAGNFREVRADHVIMGSRRGSSSDEPQLYFSVVECKSSNCGAGAKQCLVYMRDCAFVANGRKGVVYAFCTTGVFFSFIKYEPKNIPHEPERDFEHLEPIRFIFPEMINRKADWKDNCTKVIHILYTILYDQIGLGTQK